MSKNIAYKANFYSIINSLLLLLSLEAAHHPVLSSCIFSIVFSTYLYIEKRLKIDWLDVSVVVLLLYELLLGLFTAGTNNCINGILRQYLFTLYYFILRLSLQEEAILRRFLVILSVFIAGVAMISIVSFELFKTRVFGAGFDNLYEFKHLYRPFGELNNLWASIFLALLGLVLLSLCVFRQKGSLKWYAFLPLLPLLYCLLCSFSRGIYIALLLIYIIVGCMIVASGIKLGRKILYFAIIIAVLGCLSLPNINETVRTLRMTESESQKRSLAGRVNSFSILFPTVAENPLMGVGTSNYSLATNTYNHEDDNNSYTNFAPNILSQILIEKGISGTVLWILAYLLMLWRLLADRKCEKGRSLRIFCFLFISVILVREMTFPVLLTDQRMLMILSILLAVFTNNCRKRTGRISVLYPILGVISAVFLNIVVIFYYLVFENDRKHYISFKNNLENAKFDEAEVNLREARNICLTDIYEAVLNWQRYGATGDRAFLITSDQNLCEAMKKNRNDVQLQNYRAVVQYYLNGFAAARDILQDLTTRFPNNTLYRLNLANIQYLNREAEAAVVNYSRAIILTPSILEDSVWLIFATQDKTMYNKVIEQVKTEISDIPSDPIALAKYGKIWYLLGNYPMAKTCLQRAVALLPNLEAPWSCLREIALKEGNQVELDLYRSRLKLWRDENALPGGIRRYDNNRDDKIMPTMPFEKSKYLIKCISWYYTPIYSEIFDFGIKREN